MTNATEALAALVKGILVSVRPYRGRVVVLGLLLLLEMAFQAAVPLSFKFLLDRGVLARDFGFLVMTLAGLGIATVVVMAGGVARDHLYAHLGSRVLGDIRARMFRRLQMLSMSFYARAQTGDVLSRFSADLGAVEGAMAGAISWGVLPALDVLACTILLFLLDWRLALTAMLIWPLCLWGPRIFAPRASAASYRLRQEEAQTLSWIQENVAAQAVVKAFGLERLSVAAFDRRNAVLADSRSRFAFLSAMVERSAGVGIHILQVTILGVGSYLAYLGQITIGSLAAFQALFLSLSYSLSYVTQFAPSLLLAAGGMRRIEDLLSEEPEVVDREGTSPLAAPAREIAFEEVAFSYGGGQLNLDHVTFRIPPGTSAAFVGSSGAGKSTVLNLLMRFYDPQAGKSGLAAGACAGSRSNPCARASASSSRRTTSSTPPSGRTSGSASRARAKPRSRPRPAPRRSTTSSPACPKPTTPSSASAAGACPGASDSESPSRGPSFATPPSWSSTRPPPRSTPPRRPP